MLQTPGMVGFIPSCPQKLYSLPSARPAVSAANTNTVDFCGKSPENSTLRRIPDSAAGPYHLPRHLLYHPSAIIDRRIRTAFFQTFCIAGVEAAPYLLRQMHLNPEFTGHKSRSLFQGCVGCPLAAARAVEFSKHCQHMGGAPAAEPPCVTAEGSSFCYDAGKIIIYRNFSICISGKKSRPHIPLCCEDMRSAGVKFL